MASVSLRSGAQRGGPETRSLVVNDEIQREICDKEEAAVKGGKRSPEGMRARNTSAPSERYSITGQGAWITTGADEMYSINGGGAWITA